MLEKRYTPAEIEPRLYRFWEGSGHFAARPDSRAPPYTIMIPPPNVTGSLHMGHAVTFTLQDILIRWRRMQGRDALWQPGTDHAGIATQMVVERLLAKEGLERRQLGREAFLARVWQWKEQSGGAIAGQLRRLGASLDWARERFTMDEGLSRAVREVFVRLYEEGLIYRARRLVNWDPRLLTAISDLEVEMRESSGQIYRLRYPLAGDPPSAIVVATTRPETMLGDVAVAVHPEDERYKALIGRDAILPLVGRLIPIIADPASDPEMGTGALKVTPAHDFTDFAIGQRHDLPMPVVLDREARIVLDDIAAVLADIPGIADRTFVTSLAGRDRFAARAAVLERLSALNLLESAEPHQHQVPHGDRSGVALEPMLTTQWFLHAAHLAQPAIAAVERGETVFIPRQWENTFFAWMRAIEPWCISRQLWWGHRIPAWYGPDGAVFVARDEAAAHAAARTRYGEDVALAQDEDVLDTWFSSALWPFSTLGWPAATPELARYYPTDVLITGFDIIFFWVARMMMMGLKVMGEVPFRTVCIHGLVRDERGQKMAKSKGNVIDPLDLIDHYGADALRLAITALTGPGRDVKLGAKAVEAHRNFVTKLWNAARFCEMNGTRPVAGFAPQAAKLALNRWLLDGANNTIAEATAALEACRFNDYAAALWRFTWHLFCDWFLELAKPVLAEGESENAEETRATAAFVLGVILRLAHPVIPFASEELWDRLGYGAPASLIGAPWPEACAVIEAGQARDEVNYVIELISKVRAAVSEFKLPVSVNREVLWFPAQTTAKKQGWLRDFEKPINNMANITLRSATMNDQQTEILVAQRSIQVDVFGDSYWIRMAQIDIKGELARLSRERDRAAAETTRLEMKLANPGFLAHAPEGVVAESRKRLDAARANLEEKKAAVHRLELALRGGGEQPVIHTERPAEDILEEDFVPPFRVILSSGVAAKIRNGIPRASATERAGLGLPYAGLLEAGGLMMGEKVGENIFRVTDLSLTIGEPCRYYLDPAKHRAFVEAFRAKFPDGSRFGLIGSWHSHPSGEPEPSAGDLQTLKDTMAHPSTDLAFKVLLIVCLDAGDQLRTGGVVLTREPRVLSRIEVSVESDRGHTG